jgi:predicted nucleic acid-binding protein
VSYLLDTNVLSEPIRPAPDPNVIAWFEETDEDDLFISAASFAEIRLGIEILAKGRRREALSAWLDEELALRFEGRILSIDRAVGEAWGIVMAKARAAGNSMATMDGFFAATAATYRLTLVTRDVGDFRGTGVPLFDPWNPRES